MNSRTLRQIYADGRKILAAAGIESPGLEIRRILEARGGFQWASLIAQPDMKVAGDVALKIIEDIEKRVAGVPLSRIHGLRQFWGLEFEISSATLDPRADTETLIEAIIEFYQDKAPPATILDLGTGSGCLAIILALVFPEAQIVALDVSREALLIACNNAIRHNIKRIMFICGDWANSIQSSFDLVVSNPPYISDNIIPSLDAGVRNHDPILALSGGEDGLFAYRKIISDLTRILNPMSQAFLEIGFDQSESIARLVKDAGLYTHAVRPDLAGQPRVVQISHGDK